MTHNIHLAHNEGAHEAARRLVVEGAENAPCRFWVDGQHRMNHQSLFRAAATTVAEEPTLRTVRWRPHPKATVHPRLAAIVAAEHAAMDAERQQRRKVTA